jgi:hypothetical protein
MSKLIENLTQAEWERYQVPDTSVSAEFPLEPWVDQDDSDPDEAPTVALTMDFAQEGIEFQLDIAVSDGQTLKIDSSRELVKQLKAQLADAEGLELIAVQAKECEGYPGALQKLRVTESGELLTQWLIAVPEGTIFIGVTYTEQVVEPVVERFLDSIQLSVEGA